MSFESAPNDPKSQMESLIGTENSSKILDLLEQMSDGEEKFEYAAHIGADLVDNGDIDTAIKIARLLEQQEEFIEYAGGLIEYIGIDKYYGDS